jgi:GNAT superfamily N-acetyltransferase/ribosomal protein S27AE
MDDQFTLRTADDDDAERIRTVAESSMTTSYALSPGDIETIAEAMFGESTRADRREDDDHATFVAETDGESAVVGFVDVAADEGTVRHLHVDPERRGAGIGTALFERAVSELDDQGVSEPRTVAFAANNTAGAFFEQFGFVKATERTVEVGGRETVEYVYATSESVGEESTDDTDDEREAEETSVPDATDLDLPETVENGDGEVYLGDEPQSGTEAPFVQTYTDADRTDAYGYYCTNCGSTDVSMDSMERLVCGNCGNTRKPDDGYDGGYL